MDNHLLGEVRERVPFVAPRTPTEKALIEIWSAVLEVDAIGVHDDFFDLGGQSLSAALCINRVRTAFDVELSLEPFFATPAHIAAIASVIDQLRRESAEGKSDVAPDRDQVTSAPVVP